MIQVFGLPKYSAIVLFIFTGRCTHHWRNRKWDIVELVLACQTATHLDQTFSTRWQTKLKKKACILAHFSHEQVTVHFRVAGWKESERRKPRVSSNDLYAFTVTSSTNLTRTGSLEFLPEKQRFSRWILPG